MTKSEGEFNFRLASPSLSFQLELPNLEIESGGLGFLIEGEIKYEFLQMSKV